MTTPKNTTPIFIGENDQPIMFLVIGQGCTKKYYMVDIIPYNPDQYGRAWKPYTKY